MTPLPNNPATEKHVLASCLLDNGPTYQRALQNGVSDASFHDPRNRIIWKALGRCAEPALELLIPELGEHLDTAGGMPYLMEITSGIATTVHAGPMIEKLKELEAKRTIICNATALIEHANNGTSLEELTEQAGHLVPAMSRKTAIDIEKYRVRFSSPPVEPVTRLYLANKPICTPGNITTLTSKAKTGKTATLGAATAAIITASAGTAALNHDTFKFRAANPNGHAVIIFDTEQSHFDAYQCYQRSLDRAGQKDDPKWLYHYSLVGLSVHQLHETLDWALELATDECGGVFAMIIDGVADFVNSVNDEPECNAFVTWLRERTVTYNCPAICVIHSNEGDNAGTDSRGHLGKQLIRKAESNLQLKKVGEITTITSEKQRKAPITEADGVAFQWDESSQRHASVSAPEGTSDKKGRAYSYQFEDFVSIFPRHDQKPMTRNVLFRFATDIGPIKETAFRDLLLRSVQNGELDRVPDAQGFAYRLPKI